MKNSLRFRILLACILSTAIFFAAMAFPLTAQAGTLEHNPTCLGGTSSRHTIIYSFSSVSGSAEVHGLSQDDYRLVVNGVGLTASGGICGGYYGLAIAGNNTAITVQSNNGSCTGHPVSASGTAELTGIQLRDNGNYYVTGATIIDTLP